VLQQLLVSQPMHVGRGQPCLGCEGPWANT
jgi:hypothetical protein